MKEYSQLWIFLRLNPKERPRVDMSIFFFNNKGGTHSDLFNIIVYQLIICIINICVFSTLCVFFALPRTFWDFIWHKTWNIFNAALDILPLDLHAKIEVIIDYVCPFCHESETDRRRSTLRALGEVLFCWWPTSLAHNNIFIQLTNSPKNLLRLPDFLKDIQFKHEV